MTKNRQNVLAAVAIGIAALFFADKLLLTPMFKQYRARAERITELRKQVREGARLLEREQNVRARWAQMSTNTLPVNNSLAEQQILKAFDSWSQDSRISVMAITPQWRRDTEDFRTLACRVEAAGNLSTVTRFLYEVERHPLGLRVESMELAARDTDGQQFSLGMQVSGLVLLPKQQQNR